MAGEFSKWVWVKPASEDEFSIPIGCQILQSDKNKTLIEDDDGLQMYISSNQIMKSMHTTSLDHVEDMIKLNDLQEYAILRNLHLRYNKKLIYTYIGKMLIAINPYEILPIYTNKEIQMYRNMKIGDAPPHIFAIGDSAFNEMNIDKKDQCIVISGESGAGKTESTKLLLQYLATTSGKHSWIEQQIIDANPILEAFGNAKTVRNDNSSRFGKYIDIQFNENGSIEGAKIEQYLLEKSRIVSQNKGERNYHIFYSLLEGLSKEEKRKLELDDVKDYQYLTGGETITCNGRNEINEFSDIRAAMSVLTFDENIIWEIFRLLAAILHLGNLKYKGIIVQNIEATEINDNINAGKIASLLGVPKSLLIDSLTRKTIIAHGERVVSSISKETALETRDAFVKSIYGKMFIKIVEMINNTTYKVKDKRFTSIGVLDIFGFENFEVNSFEQLCINYANENLQQFFVHHIFKLEQEEYTKEGINWKNIEFVDNQDILDMIGMKPMNIMSLVDEESRFPKGTDSSMLMKLHSTHSTKSNYIKPKADHILAFGVKHFAGTVHYQIKGFLEKNRDTFSTDLKEMIMQSSNQFLLQLFESEMQSYDTTKRSATLSNQFRSSLDLLMKTLSACHPFFVRCIKPNELKKPHMFDKNLCVRQLRYSGLMETAKIRHAGYPIRHTYKDFVMRYRHCATNIGPAHKIDCREASKKICNHILGLDSDFQFGHTMIFLKESSDQLLESERNRIYLKHILVLQRGFRRVIFKNWLKKYRNAAITIQKHFRARGYRQNYLIMRNGFRRLQSVLKSRQLVHNFGEIRKSVIKLQAQCRGYLVRKNLKNKISEKSKRMQELRMLRQSEEQSLKKSGISNWREVAEENYIKRVTELSRELELEKEEPTNKKYKNNIFIEEDNKVVDDVFGFLPESETPEPPEQFNGRTQTHLNETTAKPKKPREDLSEYDFMKYAATYFRSSVSHYFSRKLLKASLLELQVPSDIIAAQAIWITILRFMGDLAEAKYEDDESEMKSVPVMQKLNATLGRQFIKSQEYNNALNSLSESDRQKLIHRTLKKKSKLPKELQELIAKDHEISNYHEWLNRRSGNLEKLHFIIGHGILCPRLRDEILCQICKQLINNPTAVSHAKGWILLSLCIGCFSPSENLEKYLIQFIRDGPELYIDYCENRLMRTIKNGNRNQPPSYLELQATKSKKPISLQVILADGSVQKVFVDSASNSEEICKQISKNLKLIDDFGFSIFITLYDKVMSLGSGSQHIMDAISNCEQYVKEKGGIERNTPFKLLYRKEIFAPWSNPANDGAATDLIYKQIVQGVNYGEYRCKTEKDIAMLAALQYFAEYGRHLEVDVLRKALQYYIPRELLSSNDNSLNKWEKLVHDAFKRSRTIRDCVSQQSAKEDIVIFGQINWTMMFSQFFEAVQVNGPEIIQKQTPIIIAINGSGVFFVNEREEVLLELSYVEILSVSSEDMESSSDILLLTITTIEKIDYVFKSFDSNEIVKLIEYMLNGLKEHSIYAVAVEEFSDPDNFVRCLSVNKGDLIILDTSCNGGVLLSSEMTWALGSCNGRHGEVPTNILYILPSIIEPPGSVLKMFKTEVSGKSQKRKSKYNTMQRKKMYTLEEYSKTNFRESVMLASSTMNSVRESKMEELWRHTRIPIKAPLLKKVQFDQIANNEAVAIFNAILKYMGDQPRGHAHIDTDIIYKSAITNDLLKDEIYCQIMRQLTDNPIDVSEERGWDLLWLATGLILPSPHLLKELNEFLKSRNHSISLGCLNRLLKLMKTGERKHPPHIIEVDAIRKRHMQIYHRVYFPNDTDEAFEIDSLTKADDLINMISKRLDLRSNDGFSLFIKIVDKAISIPNEKFLFDFIYEIYEWMQEKYPKRTGETQVQYQYQIFFMKKLWINIQPGKDKNADEIFYYHQEVPKLLNGYYKVNKMDAFKLAALIYRAEFGENAANLSKIHENLDYLIPQDIFDLLKIDEWKKNILVAYNNDNGITSQEAKQKFLEILHEYPTFGSTFFVVKQSTFSHYPKTILIAINRNGFHIIDPQTKDILLTRDYSQLNSWSSGNTYFQLRSGNMMDATRFLCETTQGYKMDELMTSYIKYLNS